MKNAMRAMIATMGASLLYAAMPAAAADTDQYGSLATGMPYDRELRIGPNTKKVGVWRLETIRFLTADGREFRWRFDAKHLDVFPLARIAPAELSVSPATTVYVNGEIPVSDF